MRVTYKQGIDMTGTELMDAEFTPEDTSLEAIAYEARQIDFIENKPRIDRGEQPDEAIQSLPGALRGDVPLSNPDEEIK